MASYIELNKQSSFPTSSGAGKVIFGVNSSGNITLTNSSGLTTPIGASGGSGILIPTPIPYSTSNSINTVHTYNEALPSPISPTWNDELLKLTYESNDLSFLAYNPKYFMFVYKNNVTGRARNLLPLEKLNKKRNKSFVHPASFSYDWDTSTPTYLNTYENFSKFSPDTDLSNYQDPFNSFITEWDVPLNKGKETKLTGFNPLRFYSNTVEGPMLLIRGNDFFPLEVSLAKNYSVSTVKHTKKYTFNSSPRLNLYIKFAIVIQNPNNTNNYVIGPYSNTIKISPLAGYFDISGTPTKYYYRWNVKHV
jgi:hypothetical protein